MSGSLRVMRDWLVEAGVSIAAMEMGQRGLKGATDVEYVYDVCEQRCHWSAFPSPGCGLHSGTVVPRGAAFHGRVPRRMWPPTGRPEP
jgi:hypothetical protein